jgi:alpha-beta hydrolase superfamily lysophospholipase
MKRIASPLVALAFIAGSASLAQAQTAARADLSGTWRASGMRVVFSGKSSQGGSDAYAVSVEKGGQSFLGKATFDGKHLSVDLPPGPVTDGIAAKLQGESSTLQAPGADQLSDYAYAPGKTVDRLQGSDNLERAHPSLFDKVWHKPVDPTDDWGGRAQIAATVAELDNIGNPGDVSSSSQKWWGFAERNPLATKVLSFLAPGLSTKDDTKRLAAFVAAEEKQWGQPVTQLSPTEIKNFPLFEAQKAIALARFGRKPADVTEGFVFARGSVDGQKIDDRRIFWQRWKPIGKPSGRMVVISPGFQETGRSFYEQIQLLNKEGDDVIVMDQQWAGYSDGTPGGLDRGFGVARDVAAVAAFAAEQAPNEKLVLFGNSMGAGPGVLGAATLNDQGLIQLQGPAMPKGVPIVLQAPFLEMSPGLLNKALAGASHVPGVNKIEMPALGLPVLTHDKTAAAEFAQDASAGDVRAETQTMTAAAPDIAKIQALIAAGKGPSGKVFILHEDKDPLANPAASQTLAKELGSKARLLLLPGDNHVLEQSPTEQSYFLTGIRWASP